MVGVEWKIGAYEGWLTALEPPPPPVPPPLERLLLVEPHPREDPPACLQEANIPSARSESRTARVRITPDAGASVVPHQTPATRAHAA